ncbi:glycosyltransferase family 2 protein [Paracoccus ravus]|uniref:glycosyltransferase family 2 protein n=1 Tax=Paracoccus ravus TaxID=2447760 RepID=UPI00106DFC22|nr:glycosyltransferase family 2 protein [Paracoccus ravus]
MQILVPISGHSNFFPAEEFYFPKPLIEVAGQPMIQLVIERLKRDFSAASFTFVVDRDEARAFSLDRVLELAAGKGAKVIERLGATSGALCSCLLAIDELDPDGELLITNSDQIITVDLGSRIEGFRRAAADAAVVTFDSVHPRWSYVVDDGNNEVMQAYEKKVVSRHAIAGIYYYRTASIFLEAAQQAILKDAHDDGLFYISATLNEIVLSDLRVKHSTIDALDFHSFYAPARISAFELLPEASEIRRKSKSTSAANVIIPAAGEGSRFAKLHWKKPKPFIDVAGKPMLSHVIGNVCPPGSQASVLLRTDHIEAEPELTREIQKTGVKIVPVSKLTEGTACTVLLARDIFDNDRPLLIANSDQLVDFDVSDFIEDCMSRGLDGSILVFRDLARDPKWSFARLDGQGLVTEVAEKKAISDLATVGLYLFTRGRDFVGAAVDMIAANERVNGEFYTCPVYNYMIAKGARIGVYEVPMEAMHGLGTPDDLTAYMQQTGAGHSSDAPD